MHFQELPRLAFVELELLSQFRHRRTFSVIDEESEHLNEVAPNMTENSDSNSEERDTVTSGEESLPETESPDYMADGSSEDMVTSSSKEVEQTKPYEEEATTAQYRSLHGRDYSTGGSDFSTSTSRAEQTSQERAYSTAGQSRCHNHSVP